MKTVLAFILLLTNALCIGQNQQVENFLKVNFLLQNDKPADAYTILDELKGQVSKQDTLYNYVVWYHAAAAKQLLNKSLNSQDYQHSLQYSLATLKDIEENRELFDRNSPGREYWTIKDIIVSYNGLSKLNEAQKYKDRLYDANKNKKLPEGINDFFNFDFFKLGDKNIWGYEWFNELPENRFSSSFTKVVYYVYSTNEDGSDKEQLYRFHVLMFHQEAKDAKFDYILERQQNTEDALLSGTYYKYTYKKDIDYKKLQNDIIEIVKGNIQPDTRRTTTQKQ